MSSEEEDPTLLQKVSAGQATLGGVETDLPDDHMRVINLPDDHMRVINTLGAANIGTGDFTAVNTESTDRTDDKNEECNISRTRKLK